MNQLATNGNITEERMRLLECLEKQPYDSITDLCKDANVVRNVYYDAIKSEDFVKLLFDNSSAGIYVAIPQIINKIIKQAKSGSFVHQKMLLEMMKIYQGTPQVAVQNNVQVNLQITDEDRIEFEKLQELKNIAINKHGSVEEAIKQWQ